MQPFRGIEYSYKFFNVEFAMQYLAFHKERCRVDVKNYNSYNAGIMGLHES